MASENENGATPPGDAATASDTSMVAGQQVVDRLRTELSDGAGIIALKDGQIVAGAHLIETVSRVSAWDWPELVDLARVKRDEVLRQQGLGAATTAPKPPTGTDTSWPEETWDQLGNVRRTLRLAAGRLVWVEEDLAWYECDLNEIWRQTPAAKRDDVAAKWCARAMEIAQTLEAGQYDDERKPKPTKADPDATEDSKRDKFVKFMKESNKVEMHSAVATQLRQRPEDFSISISKKNFNATPYELAVANGVVDLRTGDLRTARRDDYISIASPVAYDATAQAPTFMRFLEEAHPGADVRQYLQKVLGYSITGEHKHHEMWIHHGGRGGEGKSLLFKVVQAVISDHFGAANGKALVRQRSGSVLGQDMVDLGGRRLLALNETAEGARLDDEAVKSITASDTRADRPHHKGNVQHRITGKVHLVTNHLPHVSPDGGMRRRLNVIPWTVSFTDREDRDLEAKILAELPGVLAWLVEGAKAWYADQTLTAPADVALATEVYLGDEDELEAWIESNCMRLDIEGDPKAWAPAKDLYQDYRNWRFSSGLSGEPMSTSAWGRRLNGKGLPRKAVWTEAGAVKVRPLRLNSSLLVSSGLES